MYATPLEDSGDCLSGRRYYPSNNDLLRSILINEGAPGSLQSYYELARDNDLPDRWELILRRKRIFGITSQKTDPYVTTGRIRLGQLSLCYIFYSRSTARRFGYIYYSS